MGNPTSANTAAGKPLVTGGVLYAPVGSIGPTDAITALDAAFAAAGYATDKGLNQAEKADNKKVVDWGGDTVDILRTGLEVTFKFGFLEFLNPLTQQAIYGTDNVTVTAATSGHGAQLKVAIGNRAAPHKAWVFDMGTTKRIRIHVPDGQITELEDTDYKSDDLVGRGVTLSAYPDSAGNCCYIFTDDGVLAVGTVPIITGVLPSAQVATEAISIKGSRFAGSTAVTIGGTAATAFDVISDTEIVAVMPSGSAGSAPVIVTNAGGASAAFGYTRGA